MAARWPLRLRDSAPETFELLLACGDEGRHGAYSLLLELEVALDALELALDAAQIDRSRATPPDRFPRLDPRRAIFLAEWFTGKGELPQPLPSAETPRITSRPTAPPAQTKAGHRPRSRIIWSTAASILLGIVICSILPTFTRDSISPPPSRSAVNDANTLQVARTTLPQPKLPDAAPERPALPPPVADDAVACASGAGDAAIAACTREINSRRFQGHDLAVAFTNRGNAYNGEADKDRALHNYQAAWGLVLTNDPLKQELASKIAALLNATGGGAERELVNASDSGNIALVEQLIGAGVDVNWRNNNGSTALLFAARSGNLSVVSTLLAAGSLVNIQNNDGNSPLIYASSEGKLDVMRALLDAKAEVNAKTSDGNTALTYAAANGRVEVVRALLAARADINAKRNDGETAMSLAAKRGFTEIAQLLSRSAKTTQGSLVDASAAGDLSQVDALLAAKADVNAKDSSGDTALIVAAQDGHVEVVRALLTARADVNAKGNFGRTALIVASKNGRLEAVQALLAVNVDVNSRMADGSTALIFASENGHRDVVQALLAAGSDVNAARGDGETAMSLAIKRSFVEIAQLLSPKTNVTVNQVSNPRPEVKEFCEKEFAEKKSSGDLGQNPNEQGYVSWCMRHPSASTGLRPTGRAVTAGQSAANRTIASCEAEFAAKKASGALGRNPNKRRFLVWCTNP